ncbi:hypothetical protein QA601_03775 [Chitinispirillales bacterium ANBcel5]|uniref:right-handed parallel beta-helix repeat-containing protein n=1 Tax=Cellulosispirillum alkaliphilum TaxID=3039283 RepID=UPI002A559B68|nr:hypothetical protein [Chitinispirillales bacterium ANBcel5]
MKVLRSLWLPGLLVMMFTTIFSGCSDSNPADSNERIERPEITEDIVSPTTLGPGAYSVHNNIAVHAPLIIEPGTILSFSDRSGIRVEGDGYISAEGTADEPIVFTASSGNPEGWSGVGIFNNSDNNVLRYVIMEYAGNSWSSVNGSNRTNLYLHENARATVENSVFRFSSGYGVVVRSRSALFTAFSDNTFEDNATAAMRITSHQIGMIQDGNRFGIDAAAGRRYIHVDDDGELTRTATWPAVDVPYRFFGNHFINEPSAVITIEAGAVLEFDNRAGLRVNSGGLRALGTEDDEIVFTSASGNPGDWRGIGIASNNDQNTLLYTVVEKAGNSLRAINGSNRCNLYLHDYSTVTIENSTFSNSTGYGIYANASSSQILSFESNTFDNNETSAMRITSHQLGMIGENNVFSIHDLTAPRHVLVEPDGDLTQSATWRAIDVPYHFSDNHFIDEPGATITIQPGAILKFSERSGLRVNSGALIAVGTETDRIVFTSVSGNPNDWRGIGINSRNDDNELRYVTIENAGISLRAINNSQSSQLRVDTNGQLKLTDVILRNGSSEYLSSDGIVTDRHGNPYTDDSEVISVGNNIFGD